jgi:CheY-like chemotaxis protein
MLETQGWKVNEAENGRVALQKIAQSISDLIILDLMMPEMDGLNLFLKFELSRNGSAFRL